jgi:hypothetical protein
LLANVSIIAESLYSGGLQAIKVATYLLQGVANIIKMIANDSTKPH